MTFTESRIVTDVRPLQPENASYPMDVTGTPPKVRGIAIAPQTTGENSIIFPTSYDPDAAAM